MYRKILLAIASALFITGINSCSSESNKESHKNKSWYRYDKRKLDTLKVGMTIEEVSCLIEIPEMKIKTIHGDTRIEEWKYSCSYEEPKYSIVFYDGILRTIMYKETPN